MVRTGAVLNGEERPVMIQDRPTAGHPNLDRMCESFEVKEPVFISRNHTFTLCVNYLRLRCFHQKWRSLGCSIL